MLAYYEPFMNSTPGQYSPICVNLCLHEPVDGEILREAVEELRVRFPYFYVRAARKDGELRPVPNPLPMTVRNTWEPISLNAEASNFHLAAWKLPAVFIIAIASLGGEDTALGVAYDCCYYFYHHGTKIVVFRQNTK